MAIPGIVFGAVGNGRTTLHVDPPLLVHESILDRVTESLLSAYRQVRIGDPLDPDTLMGPMVDGLRGRRLRGGGCRQPARPAERY